MTNQKAVEILKNELQCVKRQINGCCDNKRDCPNCDLKLEDNEMIVAYTRAIQALEKLEQYQKINENLLTQLKTAQETIHQLREANVVEVVRCKDCKNACHKTDTTCVCGILDMIMCVEDYCSYGERNEDSK